MTGRGRRLRSASLRRGFATLRRRLSSPVGVKNPFARLKIGHSSPLNHGFENGTLGKEWTLAEPTSPKETSHHEW
jgi:hypothetical protein